MIVRGNATDKYSYQKALFLSSVFRWFFLYYVTDARLQKIEIYFTFHRYKRSEEDKKGLYVKDIV